MITTMFHTPRWTIGTKIMVMFVSLVACISAFVLFYLPEQHRLHGLGTLTAKAQTIASMTAFNVSPALVFGDTASIFEALEAIRQTNDVAFAIVTNYSGQIVASYNTTSSLDDNLIEIISDGSTARLQFFSVVVPITSYDERIGYFYLGLSTEAVDNDIAIVRAIITIVSLIIFLVGVAAAIGLSRVITAPLREMVGTTDKIAQGDLSQRASVTSEDEVGVLAQSFNLMVERLESSHRALEDINRTLEDRVVERTAQLTDEIVERTHAQQELHKLFRAVEHSSVGIIITDSEGVIEYVNPHFTKVTGYTLEEVKGKSTKILRSDRSAVTIYRDMWQTITRGGNWRGELQNRRKDGKLYWVEMSVSPIKDVHGGITHYVAVQEDVTEKKAMEQRLLQSQKLESIGTLAGGIAHDFNNILAIIGGYTAMMEDSPGSSDRIMKNARVIMNTVDRGASLVRQILTFARKAEVRRELVQANSVVTELSTLLYGTFPKTITIHLTLEPALPRIFIDPNQLHQALLNLCLNARDAMKGQGILTVSTSVVEQSELKGKFPAADHQSYVAISVSDTGEGIDAETLSRIFEPFFTTKERGKGTGLGLSVVYGIVDAHGGLIDVQSNPNTGSTFQMFFPVSDEFGSSIEPESLSPQISQRGTGTLLIVEDEAALRTMLGRSLEEQGYSILSAGDGQRGLELFQEQGGEVDLVITDVDMPKLDGSGMIRELRKLKPELPIIVMSGYLDPELKASLQELRVDEFCQKPFLPNRLLRIIRRILK